MPRVNKPQLGQPQRRKPQRTAAITTSSIRRLARRGGVMRISREVYPEARGVFNYFIETIVKDALIYMQYAQRSTVSIQDIVNSLRRHHRYLYF